MAGLTNPWSLHLQKLEVELQCPLCLKLLNRPVLLPCDHVFCDSCIPKVDSSCALCKSKHTKKSRRNLHFMDSVINIYKSLNAAISVHHKNDTNSKKGGGSRDSDMIDKDEFKSENGLTDHTKTHKQEELPESQGAKRKCDIITSTEPMENQHNDSKRQKSLMQKDVDSYFNDSYLNDSYSANYYDQLVGKTSKAPYFITPSRNITICAFCQSASVSEFTGDMLHYSRGRPVVGFDIFHSSVIHVHSACVHWAPQAYYVGDIVKNLKPELARAMKIKCTKCGLKGAALGCYVKSCPRSYHVPCARKISKCRWDPGDFLLLCPTHSSVKFPNEKSGPRLPKLAPQQTINFIELYSLEKTPAITKDLVFCGSALSQSDKRLMEKLAVKFNATISRYWNPSVTHVIASIDEKGACTRTLKVLMGILNGKWIVNADWMKASLEASKPVDEERFEIHIDTQGCQDGPKTARLILASNKPKLFDGLKFYLCGDFMKGYKEEVENLVKVAGGTILNTEDELASERTNNVVVYNIDPPVDCAVGEEVAIIGERAKKAEALSTKTGSRVVRHTWILESIAGYKLHPMVN